MPKQVILHLLCHVIMTNLTVAFRQETTNINQIPRTTETLKGITTAAEKTAYEVWLKHFIKTITDTVHTFVNIESCTFRCLEKKVQWHMMRIFIMFSLENTKYVLLLFECFCDSLKQSNIQDELNTVKVENMELIKTNCNFKVFYNYY